MADLVLDRRDGFKLELFGELCELPFPERADDGIFELRDKRLTELRIGQDPQNREQRRAGYFEQGEDGIAEDVFHATALTPQTALIIRKLGELKPTTLALMHGSAFDGKCVAALEALADGYAQRFERAV